VRVCACVCVCVCACTRARVCMCVFCDFNQMRSCGMDCGVRVPPVCTKARVRTRTRRNVNFVQSYIIYYILDYI
jgi:hypothetical protein